MHPFQAHEPLPESFFISQVTIPKDQTYSDIYESLFLFDVIITDYSSIFIDALSVGIPVVFLAPDRASYALNDQGFYIENEELPGPIVDSWPEAIRACEKLTRDGGELWRNKHQESKRFYFDSAVPYDKEVMKRVINRIKKSI